MSNLCEQKTLDSAARQVARSLLERYPALTLDFSALMREVLSAMLCMAFCQGVEYGVRGAGEVSLEAIDAAFARLLANPPNNKPEGTT